ncbi:Fc.00g114860.m01.CDS01 [Cosmosporella sp. VM-42]
MSDDFTFNDAVGAAQDGVGDMASVANALLSKLTPDERLSLLDGDAKYWPAFHSLLTEGYNRMPYIHGEVKRLGIPGVRFADGPRGCVVGESTAFPVPMARGASWDIALEERIGVAIGRECRAQGANFFGGVCVNLPRHPAWGRIQETYGEDPILLGEMGAALTRGIQNHVMACVKHFALNSMENARFQVDVDVDEATLHEVYLPHFRRIVEEGVASVMSSYNSVRGEWAGQNKELLLDILRDQWGFKGFVMSDFLFGLRDAPLSLKNGLDIEAPFQCQRALHLKTALETGEISQFEVDRAGLAILRGQIEDATRRDTRLLSQDVVFCDEHRKLAKEAALKSMVLLENKEFEGRPTLPLGSRIAKMAVLGRLANSTNTGDRGSSAVRCPEVASSYRGLKESLPETEVILEESSDTKKIKAVAAAVDVAVVIVGYDYKDEGEFTVPPFQTNPALKNILPPDDGSKEAEHVTFLLLNEVNPEDIAKGDDNYGLGKGGDRTSLRLPARDVETIKAAAEANPRTIVAIVAAGAVIMEEWKDLPAAIVLNWYSGSEGGHALADLLLGRANFAGRLPFSIPTTEHHLPFFDKNATRIIYDRWFGQRLLDKLKVEAAYPLGFGCSYTSFKISDLEVQPGDNPETLHIKAKVSNTGSCKGRYIAQVYGTVDVPDWPRRALLGFEPVDLEAGVERSVNFIASARPLQRWDKGTWKVVSEEVRIDVGGFCGDVASVQASLRL